MQGILLNNTLNKTMGNNKYSHVEGYLKSTIKDVNHLTIVMNGVIDKECGQEIDNSEVVFRFNLFQAHDRTKIYVGKKTSHWFVNACPSMARHQKRIALCPFPSKKYDQKYIVGFKQHGEILFTAQDYREYKYSSIEFPTTGYTAVLMLLRLFNLPLHIYGMDGLVSGHYWEHNHTHASKHSKGVEVNHLKDKYADRILWK